jgi:hypothetical protein
MGVAGDPFLRRDGSASSLEALNYSRNEGDRLKPQKNVNVGGHKAALHQRCPFFNGDSGEVLAKEIGNRRRYDRRPQPGGPHEMNKEAIVEHAPRSWVIFSAVSPKFVFHTHKNAIPCRFTDTLAEPPLKRRTTNN